MRSRLVAEAVRSARVGIASGRRAPATRGTRECVGGVEGVADDASDENIFDRRWAAVRFRGARNAIARARDHERRGAHIRGACCAGIRSAYAGKCLNIAISSESMHVWTYGRRNVFTAIKVIFRGVRTAAIKVFSRPFEAVWNCLFPIRYLLTRARDRNNFRDGDTMDSKESWLHPDSSNRTSSTASSRGR